MRQWKKFRVDMGVLKSVTKNESVMNQLMLDFIRNEKRTETQNIYRTRL